MTDTEREPARLAKYYADQIRAELAAKRATKCACGVERRFCNEHKMEEAK